MSKKVELKVVSSTAFAKVINEIVEESNGTVNHLEAVHEFLEHNEEIEPETIATLIKRNQKLQAILYENAEKLNLVEKKSRLPID